MTLTLSSTIKLNSGTSSAEDCEIRQFSSSSLLGCFKGYDMPLLGLGVYQNTGESCTTACIAALKAGYRFA